MLHSGDMLKINAWIEQNLGGKVERCERQVRWRPGWLVDLRLDGELLPLYVRGDRNEEFPPWPLEYERDVIALLQGSTIPVPKIYGFCPDPRAIVLERVAGRPNLKSAQSEGERLAVLHQLAEHVAAMHSLDIEPFVQAGMKMPLTAEERAVPFFLEGEKLYLRYKNAPDPRMEFVRNWVRRNLPVNRDEVCFLHGDPGQFLFEDGEITSMLDFEWACLGDPLMDLGGLRLRAVHEPMGDIRPLFRRYAELTGRAIDGDVLGFHTVAFIANTCLAISPAVGHPQGGVDYPEYVNWYIVALLFSLKAIAEVKGVVLIEPEPQESGKPSRWAGIYDVMDKTFGPGKDSPEEEAEDHTSAAYERSLATALVGFARNGDRFGDRLDKEYVRDVSVLLGREIIDWQTADRELEDFVQAAGGDRDAELLNIFYRWSWSQIHLLEGVIDNDMWNVALQPLSGLASRSE